jgi:hypothetical protein
MSNKDKKFQPDAGFVVAVHQNILGIRAVASTLNVFPETLAEAMATMGFQFIPDPFNLSSDAGKVIALQNKKENANISLVQDPAQKEADNE